MNSPQSVTLRRMRLDDVPQLSTLHNKAYAGDPVFDWTHPYREDYALSYNSWRHARLKIRLLADDFINLIVEVEETVTNPQGHSENRKRVAGYACWKLVGLSDLAGEKATPLPAWPSPLLGLEKGLLRLQSRYIDYFDQSVDRVRYREFNRIQHEHPFWTNMGPHLHLNGLAVDPEFQGKGIGTRLMRWGMQRAESMGVKIGLDASLKGKQLYSKLGFEVVEKKVVNEGQEGEPIEFVGMLWVPSMGVAPALPQGILELCSEVVEPV